MKKIILGLLTASLFLTSCKKEEEKTIKGKWTIDEVTFFGISAPGDGSYLIFDGCDTECTGQDYKNEDETIGSFTYQLNDDESTLTIQDDQEDGGDWTGEWEIIEFTDNKLVIVLNTFFGPATYELSK